VVEKGELPRTSKRLGQVKVKLELNLLACDGAHGSEVVVVKIVVVVLIRVATGAGHRLRGQSVVAEVVGGRGRDLGVGTATARGGHTGVDARHTETVGTRKGGGKTVAVAVLGWGGGLAVRGLLPVPKIG
jgi:hypothetical protein